MTERSRSITHATFVVERTYPVAPARVFAAWADPAIKASWFGDPSANNNDTIEFDFRQNNLLFIAAGRDSYDSQFFRQGSWTRLG